MTRLARPARWARIVFVAAMCVAAITTSANTKDEAARIALAAKDFAKVQETYGDNPLGNDSLSASAHYRLAIASIQLGQPIAAGAHLERALALAPSGDFASSQDRIRLLRQQIAAACEKKDCTIAPPAAAPAAPAEPAALSPVREAAPITATTAATTTLTSVAAETPPASLAPPAIAATAPEDPRATNDRTIIRTATWTTVFWAIVFAICWFWVGRTSSLDIALAQAPQPPLQPPLQHHLEQVRDSLATLLARIDHAGGSGTELQGSGRLFLALIERECGRTRYRTAGDTSGLGQVDADTARIVAAISARPLSVTVDDAAAVDRLFRRAVL